MDVDTYLGRTVDGYLLGDLKRIRELPPQPVGACLFPAVMAIFSGIEFLGALDFPKPFDRHDDEEHFKHFWSQIYQTDPRKCSGAAIRTTVRHGIAHAFMPQIPYGIMLEGSAKDHLVRDHDGAVLVSVGMLIDDFTAAYRQRFWPADAAARDLGRWRSRLMEMHSLWAQPPTPTLPFRTSPKPLIVTNTGPMTSVNSPTVRST